MEIQNSFKKISAPKAGGSYEYKTLFIRDTSDLSYRQTL